MVSLEMTRAKLRRALEALQHEGRIWRHVGKGTFLAGDGAERLADLSAKTTPVQMMRARLAFEPALAQEATINASADDLESIRQCLQRTEAAASWDEYEARDDQFHRSIAEATGNVLLLSLFDKLNQVRRAVAWSSVIRDSDRPARDHASFAEHDRVASAIELRDPTAARAAMRDHLRSVAARLFGEV